MLPLEPLTVALPLAIVVLALGWRPWTRGAAPGSGPIASALAIGGGWIAAWVVALGTPAFPPRDARERLLYALALAILLAPLESLRLRRWMALAWFALAAVFTWQAIPPMARSHAWEGASLYGVLAAIVAWLLLARAATGWLLARQPRGPLVGAAFGITLLAAGIAQGLGGSIGLATGFAGAAVGACCVALVARVRPQWESLRAGASVLAMAHAGGLVLAVLTVPGFTWSAAILLALAPFTAALPLGDARRDTGWFARMIPVLSIATAAVCLV